MPPFALALPGRTISVSPPGSSDPHGVHSLDEPARGPASASDLSLVAPTSGTQNSPVWALSTTGTARRVGVSGANSFIAVYMHSGGSIATKPFVV